jgi:hypothetical protein
VSAAAPERLRIGFVSHTIDDAGTAPLATAAAMEAAGHDVVVFSSHRHPTRTTVEGGVPVVRLARLPEAPLRARGFTGPLTHAPLLRRALSRGGYHVVHAFTPEDAAIALRGRGRHRLRIVFTAAEPLGRDRLADRRLRLRAVAAAVEESDAVTAPDAERAALVERWLAVRAQVIDPHDAGGHERLYRGLIA